MANAFETNRELDVAMPITAQIAKIMQTLMAGGRIEVDHAGLALYYKKSNNLSLKTGA